MKQTKLFLLTCILTIAATSALMYSSSCKKDKCKGVVCQNTGYCSGGACVCPTGYSGTHCEISTITYRNNSYTDMNIRINGTDYTIAAGGATSFTGNAGTAISVSNIYTQGSYGVAIDWASFTDYFPTNGDQLTEPFDVAAGYVYLMLRNISVEPINSWWVNYNWSSYTHEYPYIPNDGQTYGIGYYVTSTGAEIYAESGTYYWSWYPSMPYTSNASVTVTAN